MTGTSLAMYVIFIKGSNSVISDFSICDSETLDKVYSTFCMHMYDCELWNLNSSDVQKFYIAWRKVKRRIWKLPSTTHNSIIHNITSNIHIILEKRFIKFMHNALNGNIVCRQILYAKLRCKSLFLPKIIDIYLGNIILVIVIGMQILHVLWVK